MFIWAVAGLIGAPGAALETIGVTLLRTVTTNLNGAGIRVALAEGEYPFTWPYTNTWQVNPAVVGRPGIFTYISRDGTSTNFPNALGFESDHADSVAVEFLGVATNVAHVDNFEAEFFCTNIIWAANPPDINDRVVNQSFIFDTNANQQAIDSKYDDYAARYNTLFVNGAGNGNPPTLTPPATCYNGIAVGARWNGVNYSTMGPTPDNGRCKPDITAPHNVTSFTAPQVAGAAAVLTQAGLRGDGGGDTDSAADIRTIKALLLNGAIKPADWTNAPFAPLDARYGAGVLNVFNSYQQLAGGKQTNHVTTTVSPGDPHPPTGATNTIGALSGWSFTTNDSTGSSDQIHHYCFDVANGDSNAAFTATATLVWNRQEGKTAVNDLNLYLYATANSNLVACSTSVVDNVEHLFVPRLSAGRYDLQVFKSGGNGGGRVTDSEVYALAFEFFSVSLNIERAGTNAILTWPVYPAGFVLESTTNLASSAWTTNNPPPTVTNSQNRVVRDAAGGNRFFRLRRP